MLEGTMKVTLPDGSGLDLPDGASGLDAAAAVGSRLAKAAVAVQVDGEVRDVRLPVHDGEKLRILTDRDPEALAVLRHSTAHVMAQAVLHLWPEAKIAIGPAIADGFYYDFEFPQPIGADDLERIEAEMRRILKHQVEFVREEDVDKAGLVERFRAEHQPYKLELVEGLPDGEISLYRNDDFEDLCRGPHLQTTAPIRAFKLLSQAGAYWRGDSSKPMLTRIYGTAFFKQADLDEHLRLLEEARRRDHRRIGRELDLFHTSESAPGAPFWHPRGMVIWNELTQLWRELNRDRGYREVRTPIIYSVDVWRRSGHWDKYRDNSSIATSRPARCTGCSASSTSPRTTPTSSAPTTRCRTRSSAASSWPATSTESSTCRCGSSSRRGPTTGLATMRCGTARRRRSRGRSRGRGRSTS